MNGKIRSWIKRIIERLLAKQNYKLVWVSRERYPSETSKCRPRLQKYCTGYGVDLGFGGDPINDTAIRVDQFEPYSNVGSLPVQLGGDAAQLNWFKDEVLDFIFSSHLLEDFIDTKPVLTEWLRVLKPGGRLILFCPDEQVYREHCTRTQQPYNTQHKIADFSLERVKSILDDIGKTRVVYENSLVDQYSWDLVVEKIQ